MLFITFFKNAGFLSLFPIIFIVVGIYIILTTLFMKRNKELILTVVSINEDKDGTCNVLLSDDNIHDNSWKTIMYKYFIYSTRKKEKFVEGKKYKVNIYKYGISLELIPIDQVIQAMSLEKFSDEDFEEKIV